MNVHPLFRELSAIADGHDELVAKFQNDGVVTYSGLLSAAVLNSLRRASDSAISLGVWEEGSSDPYRRAFKYLMNARLEHPLIDKVARAPRLAQFAARLLNVNSLRLTHDQLLYKPAGASSTPIHADQYNWPVSGEETLTVWIPLQRTPADLGSLAFYKGSHKLSDHVREALSQAEIQSDLHDELTCKFELETLQYELGDVSFHKGWTFHRALPNTSNSLRRAFSIVYMKSDLTLTPTRTGLPLEALSSWCPGAVVGGSFDEFYNPVVYQLV